LQLNHIDNQGQAAKTCGSKCRRQRVVLGTRWRSSLARGRSRLPRPRSTRRPASSLARAASYSPETDFLCESPPSIRAPREIQRIFRILVTPAPGLQSGPPEPPRAQAGRANASHSAGPIGSRVNSANSSETAKEKPATPRRRRASRLRRRRERIRLHVNPHLAPRSVVDVPDQPHAAAK